MIKGHIVTHFVETSNSLSLQHHIRRGPIWERLNTHASYVALSFGSVRDVIEKHV